MNKQFKFEKHISFVNTFYDITPEQVIMLDIQKSMKAFKFRSFSSYLKDLELKRIQRTTISLKQMSVLLNTTMYGATDLAVKWMNDKNIGGTVVDHAGINAYYLNGVYEIVN